MNKNLLSFTFLMLFATSGKAQHLLSLDSCRTLALHNNKGILIGHKKETAAHYEQKAAHTNLFPKLSFTGTYMHNSNSISLLSNRQEKALSQLGTSLQEQLKDGILQVSNILPPNWASLLQLIEKTDIVSPLNSFGQRINDFLRTDTRDIWGGTINLTQPIYMGGKITAYNLIAKQLHEVAGWEYEQKRQSIILATDEAYWQVLSLTYKKRLAEDYFNLVKTLENDIYKLVDAGMATHAEKLAVGVKVNEAEMTLSQVENGLALSRMNLCQLCGLPLYDSIRLSDENLYSSSASKTHPKEDISLAQSLRPELQCLTLATHIYQEKIRLAKSEYLPSIALTGNFFFSNPSLLNGFERKFRGTWNIGILVNVPLFHWGEGVYKIKKAQAEAHIAQYELEEAKELVTLQIQQAVYQSKEAYKRLNLTNRNIGKAQENLRIANLGFKEGIIPSFQVMEAQTAWFSAQSAHIDALINIQMTETILQKAKGEL